MKIIEDYKKSLQEIYDHVGFVEDWVIYPIDDKTECYWYVMDREIHYADSIGELIERDGNYYVDDLYTQRFYKKHVYEGTDFTMIFCDSGCDGMKYFRLFDNSKLTNQNKGKGLELPTAEEEPKSFIAPEILVWKKPASEPGIQEPKIKGILVS